MSRRLRAALALGLVCLTTTAFPAHAKSFQYLTYAEITDRLSTLAEMHAEIITVDSAQRRYGLPSVGKCSESSAEDDCKTWVVTLTDRASLPADPGRPQLLLSGEVHGDEVVGPHAVLAYVEMVARKAREGDPYFTRMLRTRVVVALPMANAVGFHRGERGERQGGEEAAGGRVIDPNRDFAFDQEPEKCMQTVAARVINELFLDGLFRVLVTFHGGTNVLGYEWGDMSHCDKRVCSPAPDQAFMRALGDRMSGFAGGLPSDKQYPVGTMGALVYPVHGGMEDWAYGASWSGQAVACRPDTLGGYPVAKTTYNQATHRCVTYLVETASAKRPPESTLGSDADMLTAGGGVGDGHVPRNVRLIVAAVDAVEPYVVFSNATLVAARDGDGSGGHEQAVIHWFVAGSFAVDGTHLEWSDMDDTEYGTSDIFNGTAGAPISGAQPTVFRAVVPKLPTPGTPIFLRAAAVVDSAMGTVPVGASSSAAGHVQTHIVGSRVLDSWSYENGGAKIRGRRVWYTPTMRAVVDPVSGKLSVSADSSKKNWESSGLDDHTPTYSETETALLAGSGKGTAQIVQPDAADAGDVAESAALGHSRHQTGVKPVLDPRDRDAVFSGVIGVILLLSMTGVIVVAIVKHYRVRREEKEAKFTVSEEEELNEPLQKGGIGGGGGGGGEAAGVRDGVEAAASSIQIPV